MRTTSPRGFGARNVRVDYEWVSNITDPSSQTGIGSIPLFAIYLREHPVFGEFTITDSCPVSRLLAFVDVSEAAGPRDMASPQPGFGGVPSTLIHAVRSAKPARRVVTRASWRPRSFRRK